MPKFAANISMMFNEVPFLERFAAAAECGFQAVEFLFPYEFPPEAIADVAEVRGIRARPAAVQRMSVSNLNIVTQRLDGEPFDLVIATNVFIYYDLFEQALAMSNVEAMLKPGAFLLANVSAPDLKAVTIRPVDTTTTLYARGRAANENLIDFLVWYKAHAN